MGLRDLPRVPPGVESILLLLGRAQNTLPLQETGRKASWLKQNFPGDCKVLCLPSHCLPGIVTPSFPAPSRKSTMFGVEVRRGGI